MLSVLLDQIGHSFVMGAIYGLVALGFNLIFGILGLIHFAHFEVYMVGAFMGLMATAYLKTNTVVVFLVAMLSAGILGVIVEKITFRPIRKQPAESQLFASIGVSIMLQNAALLIWGTEWMPFPKLFKHDLYNLGWFSFSNVQLIVLLVVTVLLFGLWVVLFKTKIGIAVRAVSYNRDAATLMGINTNTTISISFGVASMLAGAAGVIVGIYYNMVWALMGSTTGLKAVIAVVIGGIGSLVGSVVGGLILGMAEGIACSFISSTWRDGIAFGIFILVLLIKPSGLFKVQKDEKI
jgi:branched-chain amino acid transport system permease protein